MSERDRSAILEDAWAEGDTENVLDELSNKDGDITLEDLRRLPGASEKSDEELQQLWDASQSSSGDDEAATPTGQQQSGAQAAQQLAAATGGEAVKTSRGWKVYDDAGNEIADFSKLTTEQLLKSKFGYNANGKEHRKSLDEVFRVASYGHHNEQKLARANAERDNFYRELQTLRPQAQQYEKREKLLNYALTQFHLGNDKPLQQLINAHKNLLGSDEAIRGEAAPRGGASDDSANAAGQRYFYETIVPKADAIASRYGAKSDEVRKAVLQLIEREPAETLSEDKINEIINVDIPYLLQQAGYSEGVSATAAQPSNEVAELQKQIAELRAAMGNRTLDTVRQRNKSIPGKLGDSANSSADESSTIPAEATQSRESYRKFLKS